ncbi:phage head spike fiber domain-containing protein [Devosia salina]|uniref:Uncharacterized protein n=1 Tax=Devosia salina TaxID=2860336 RepID=A0ABX8W7Y7_9HYPH|nr:hypothetical protein [Devosia salina]QYO75085.1 hypothetical protein K1X15_10430 [Devosia salina]
MSAPSAIPKFKSLDTLTLADQDCGVVSFFALPGSAIPLRTHVFDGTGNTATSWTVSGSTISKGGTIENNPALTRHIADVIETYPNGLVRLWTTFRNVSGSPLTYAAHPHIQGTTGVPAMATACWMGGHQLEKGRWPTSQIITNGSTTTRAADSLSLPAATAGAGSAPSFALAARYLGGQTGFPWLPSLNDGSAANEIGLYVAANAGSLNRKVNTAVTAQTDVRPMAASASPTLPVATTSPPPCAWPLMTSRPGPAATATARWKAATIRWWCRGLVSCRFGRDKVGPIEAQCY